MKTRSRVLAALIAVALTAAVASVLPHASAGATVTLTAPVAQERATGTVRNAIVFLVDDMADISCASARLFLPRSSHWLRDRGTCYENASTSTPVCCPARAQIQTGRLAHNNNVRTQLDARLLDPTETVQHDLSAAGIHTYGVGKNLNGIKAASYFGPDAIDTGFDDFDFWNSYQQRPGTFALYDDEGRSYVPNDGLYSTEVNAKYVDEALDDYLATGERFFIYDAFFAPHKQEVGASPAALPEATADHVLSKVPRFRYTPEADTRDKLPLFQEQRRSKAYYRGLWAAKVRAMYDVDDAMADTFQRLEDAGVLDETAVIFTSDNGYTDLGQYNWDGKAIPYPAATNIPMLAWYPGARRATVTKGVQLIDVPATLYDVLGVTPRHRLDGHSLRSTHRRKAMYGEFFGERDSLVLEESGRATGYVKTWRLLKRGEFAYVEWYRSNGTLLRRELYKDQAMTRNLLWKGYRGQRPSAATIRSLHVQMRRLANCVGTVQDGSPRPCT